MSKKDYICPYCKSNNILWDAYASWNAKEQCDELHSSYEYCYCNHCGSEDIVAEEIEINE